MFTFVLISCPQCVRRTNAVMLKSALEVVDFEAGGRDLCGSTWGQSGDSVIARNRTTDEWDRDPYR